MAHQIIGDFRAGLDRRKSILTSPPGTFYVGKNIHLTSGGEIVSRLAFVPYATVPPLARGLASNASTLYTFGPPASPGPALPAGMVYQAITHPTGKTLVRIVGHTMFKGLPYVLALYDDGTVVHFYNGTIVPAWAPGGSLAAYTATGCVTLGQKVYVVAGPSLHGCELNTPLVWNTGVNGAFTRDLSSHLEGSVNLSGIAVYIDKLAIFAPKSTQVWFVDPDPAKDYIVQTLPNLGTIAGGSVMSYGDSDVFLLARTGIRSLRARELSAANLATSYDIGAPVDPSVKPLVRALGAAATSLAVAIVDPVDARYLLALGSRVFVFSFFPAGEVSAWSEYDLGATVSAWATVDDQLFALVGDRVYLYGGVDGATYDNSPYEVVLPYLDGKAPATLKAVGGVDIGCEGEWTVEIGMNPDRPDERELVARLVRSTFGMGRVSVNGEGTHIGFRLSGSGAKQAKLTNIIVHFTPYDDKDAGA
jgi:hypothetical protein